MISFSTIAIIITGLLTAIFSAVFGVAGGMMLFVILSIFLNASLAVPIHAITQLISNGTRVAVSFSHIDWKIVGRYAILIIPGALLGSMLFRFFNPNLLEILVGSIILLVVYVPIYKTEGKKTNYNTFIILGFVSGFLGMIIGVVGPLISPFFSKNGITKQRMVATKAACQTMVHLVKIPTFGFILKFDYSEYSFLIISLCLVTVIGTFVGKNLIDKISDDQYHQWEKYILSILSIILIVKAVVNYFM